MQTVLIAGAGKSSSWLIDYMLNKGKNKWNVILIDANEESLHEKLNNHPEAIPAVINIANEEERQTYVKQADIVLSLMPSELHFLLAQDCLKFKKHLITSSYISEEIMALNEEAQKEGVMFMCEMGVDPGIDHMAIARTIRGIRRIGGEIISLKTACGGLMAPDFDENPWNYKFCWNPHNVVTAGKTGATWKEHNKLHHVEYNEIFDHPKALHIDGLNTLAAYPNRDVTKYIDAYDVPEAQTITRSTIRYPHFIKAWSYLVKAGLTSENDSVDAEEMTYSNWIAQKTGLSEKGNLIQAFKEKYQVDDQTMRMLDWLQLFSVQLINGKKDSTSAAILQNLLSGKWRMRPSDQDMVLMRYEVDYERRGEKNHLVSTLKVIGKDRFYSAMAKTAGLPMGILAAKVLRNEIDPTRFSGVRIPTDSEIYTPVLKELTKYGIEFNEEMN